MEINTEDMLRKIVNVYGYTENTYDGANKDKQLEDSNQTREQKKRDEQITRLLTEYVDAYHEKAKTNQSFKGILFTVSIILFSCLVSICILYILITMVRDRASVTDAVSLVAVCVTMIGSIAFLLEIIAKHIFPENEEKNITEIVKAIQNNDLEDKRINIGALKKQINMPEQLEK